jgi:hypothetical protein
MPDSVTCCGLVEELSLSESDAGCVPSALGVNAIPSVHDFLGATVMGIPPQVPVLVSAYSESEGVEPEMTSALVLPVFVTFTVLVSVCPTGTFPNAREPVTDTDVGGMGEEGTTPAYSNAPIEQSV